MRADFATALTNLGSLVDGKTGIINSVEVVSISETDPQVFLAHATPSDTTPLANMEAANRGAACSVSRERAIIRACGESVERYCSAFLPIDEFRLASENELASGGDRFICFRDLYPYLPDQYQQADFPYRNVDPDCRIRWVTGKCAVTSQAVWVPASCVYVPYLFDVSVEPFTHMPISTGLAAGPTLQACVDKGICEILERDALMLAWYNRSPAPRILPESCRGFSPLIDDMLAWAHGRCHWFINYLTRDVDVPVISAALIDERSPPLTSFGISSDPDPVRALTLALEEAALTRLLLNRSQELIESPTYVHERYRTLRDHMLAHASSDRLRAGLRFLTDEGPVKNFGELVQHAEEVSVKSLARILNKAGFEVIWVDVTTADVADLNIRVARTLIPGMQPLDNDHDHRYLGGKRLTAIPELNPDPHPFP